MSQCSSYIWNFTKFVYLMNCINEGLACYMGRLQLRSVHTFLLWEIILIERFEIVIHERIYGSCFLLMREKCVWWHALLNKCPVSSNWKNSTATSCCQPTIVIGWVIMSLPDPVQLKKTQSVSWRGQTKSRLYKTYTFYSENYPMLLKNCNWSNWSNAIENCIFHANYCLLLGILKLGISY